MISVVGVALNKDGKPFVRSEPVDNLRPICIGDWRIHQTHRGEVPIATVRELRG